jgi:hypothetical protein
VVMGTRQVGSAGTSGTGGAGPAGRTRCVSNASATASSDLQRTGHIATRPVGPAKQTDPPAGGKTTSPRERRTKRRAARNATLESQNKQTNGPTENDACPRRRVVVGGCVRARECACTPVGGCVGGRGVRVPLRARFSRRGALRCLRLLRGARDFASPDAIGGVRRRRGRILHRRTPQRCACERACVRACVRVCARASVCVRVRALAR